VNRVVITGLGAVTPLGNTVAPYWDNLKKGVSGLGPLTVPQDADTLLQKIGGEVKDFDPAQHLDEREIPQLDRVSQFAIVAAREAVAHSGIAFDTALSARTATIVGTGAGGQSTLDDGFRRIYKDNRQRAYPLTIPKAMVNAPASQVCMHCGLRGPAFAVASACASATHAIGLAFQMVRSGMVDCAVTGGTEACLTYGTVRAWEALRVMAPDLCRPFSAGRQGMILGEGAAMLVLEPLERAQARGATILAELAGFGMSADAADLIAPDVDGMSRAMQGALDDAGVTAEQVQYINAHGTGTTANDETETKALHQVFGAQAKKLAVSSTKSMTGHSLGAAGALEAVATVMAVRDSVAPPTIGWLGRDPACDLDYVPNEARPLPIDIALSNSFAFGGLNAVLAVRRFH
jgi:nodulation protein E